LYCSHCINQTFAKQDIIKKRAIMLGPIFDPALQLICFIILLYVY
jgi:hypothetical protein